MLIILTLHIFAYMQSNVSRFQLSDRCTVGQLVEKIISKVKIFYFDKIQSFIFNLQQSRIL